MKEKTYALVKMYNEYQVETYYYLLNELTNQDWLQNFQEVVDKYGDGDEWFRIIEKSISKKDMTPIFNTLCAELEVKVIDKPVSPLPLVRIECLNDFYETMTSYIL